MTERRRSSAGRSGHRGDSVLSQIARWWRDQRRPRPLGPRGEAEAARYLKRQGYQIVARSARTKFGELDLVAVDGRTVVFVEVKTRQSSTGDHPAESVDDEKQRRLTTAALGYLRRHGLLEHASRFDVVAITWPPEARKPQIEHFKNAFPAVGQGQMFN